VLEEITGRAFIKTNEGTRRFYCTLNGPQNKKTLFGRHFTRFWANKMWQFFALIGSILFVSNVEASKHYFEAFQSPSSGEFGLADDQSDPCLVLRFHAQLYNFNLNGTDIATELADFTLKDVRLSGYCALHNEVRKQSQLQADWSTSGRRKTLRFEFREAFVRSFSQQVDELRWQLHRVVYIEKFNGNFF
jgi:hypothetical protein